MKILQPSTLLVCLLLAAALAGAAPLTSSFTYQGRLVENSSPANGSYDLSFKLFDALAGGGQAGATVTNLNVAVSNGLFTVPLDFGPTVFNGTAYWLEIAVRPTGGGAFTLLNPRQPLTATPYAWHAASAAQAASVTANAINSTALVDASVTSNKIAGGQVVKSLNGLRDQVVLLAGANLTLATNGNALTLATAGWGLGGNAGTVPGQTFLGTTDNQPLELRVNNQRFLLVTPMPESPNLIGGFSGNTIAPAAVGAVIAGGGQTAEINISGSSFSLIGGGRDNWIGTNSADSSIVAGNFNTVFDNASATAMGGGFANTVQSYSHFATVAGGGNNTVLTNAQGAAIGGGEFNSIEADAAWAGVGSGSYNTNQASFAVISGGHSNLISSTATYGVIAGGEINYLGDAEDAVVGGGYNNTVADGALFGTIAGGARNYLSAAQAAVVGGGYANFVGSYSHFATIAGGANNMVFTNASGAVIAGGQYNSIETDAEGAGIASGTYNTNQAAFSTIGGGHSNRVSVAAPYGVIAGGEINYLGAADNAVVGGGYYNYVDDGAHLGTVAGGNDNWIKGNAVFGTIPGGSRAAAESYGQQAYASGTFATWGDAQASLFVLRGTSTGTTPIEIFLDGASERISVANTNSSWTFQIIVVGRNTTGGTACLKVEGGIKNVGGTVSLVGTPTVTQIATDAGLSTATVTVTANNASKALSLTCRVTAGSGSIRWVARVQTVELRF